MPDRAYTYPAHKAMKGKRRRMESNSSNARLRESWKELDDHKCQVCGCESKMKTCKLCVVDREEGRGWP